jgi:glycine hydroxymethyltransferase
MDLKKTDSQIFKLIEAERKRQGETLMMIPSENYVSRAVLEASGSLLTNKYSEGYPGKRYYQGNLVIDEIENLAIERAKEIFDVPYVNVQPLSGSPANAAVYFALLQPGDKIMGMKLSDGGHLTHGHPKITFSGRFFETVQYGVGKDGLIDYQALARQVKEEKPKLIVCGFTAYPRLVDFAKFAKIADLVDAYLLADISHIAGLVAGKIHPTPIKYAHVVTTTTHKTLRGPRGAMVMVTKKGLRKDKELRQKIDKAIIPGLQGGPHNHITAAIAVCLREASKVGFRTYVRKIVQNSNILADELNALGWQLSTGGTDNHLLLADVRPFGVTGKVAAEALECGGIIVNANSIPNDSSPPYRPSGIRFGTPALTTRGMGIPQMREIATWMQQIMDEIKGRGEVADGLYQNQVLRQIGRDVARMCKEFPLPE